MTLLSIVADVLWILALSIMAATSRMAWRRTTAGTLLPLRLRPEPGLRLKRSLALPLPVVLACLLGLGLLWAHRGQSDLTGEVILFGVRATLAAVLALLHLQWLKGALEALEAEGRLNG